MSEVTLLDRDKTVKLLSATEDIKMMEVVGGRNSGIVFGGDESQLTLKIKGEEFKLGQTAFVKAGRNIGLPESYTSKTPIALINAHLNYWYSDATEQTHLQFYQDSSSKIVGITNKKVDIVSDVKILDIVSEVIGKPIGYHRPTATLNYSQFSVVGDKQFSPLVDDLLYGGVQVQNSVMGEKPIEVCGFIFRQVCSNGAISNEMLYKWSRKSDVQDIDSWIRTSAQAAYASVDREFSRIKKLTETPISGHVQKVLTSLFREYKVPATMQKLILTEIEESGAETLYDIYNAVAKVATHSESAVTNPFVGRRMQLIAGEICQHNELCETCHKILE